MANSRAEVGFAVVLAVGFAVVDVAPEAGLFGAVVFVAWKFDGFLVTAFGAGFSGCVGGLEVAAGTEVGAAGSSFIETADSTEDVLTTRDEGCSLALTFPSRLKAAVPS